MILFLLVLSSTAFAQPSISFESLSHDFGAVESGQRLEHGFVFKNTGTEELVIEKLEAS